MGRIRFISLRAGELLLVALAGGGLALGGAALLGDLGNHTTIQQLPPPTGGTVTNATIPTAAKGLSAEEIYKQDAPGVVQITATTTSTPQGQLDPFGNPIPAVPQTSESLGSGFVLDKAGHIVTNYHVVHGSQKVFVSFSGKDQLPAHIVGTDPSTDTAVLAIAQHGSALTPLELGDSDRVRVGDTVFAIGNPFGYTRTLTSGIVSAVQRRITAPNTLPIDNVIQTDTAINHGNSGGPLLDAQGRVIGVTSQIYSDNSQSGNIGIGFAIPVNLVRNVAGQIISTGKAAHAYLGVVTSPVTPALSKLFHLPASGLLVLTVDQGSGAAKAGIKQGSTKVIVEGESYVLGGDVIVAVDRAPVSRFEQLRDAIARKKPGDKLKIELFRQGSKKSVTVTLSQAPGGTR
ncbi:MAG: S1C family serine protease [Gaiellaceae bacterium]